MGLIGKQPGIVAFTAAEVAGIAAWVALAGGIVDPAAYGVAVSAAGLGAGVLFAALVLKHVLADVTVNGLRFRAVAPSRVVLAATETGLWAGWLFAAEWIGGLVGVGAAGVGFAVLLVPLHGIEDAALRDRASLSRLLEYWTLSVVEATAGTALLALVVEPALLDAVAPAAALSPMQVGVGLLAILLFVEHNACVRAVLRSGEKPGGESAEQSDAAVVQ